MATDAGPSRGPDERFCSSCGEIIDAAAAVCPACGVRQGPSRRAGGERDPVIAAVLSFIIVGLGQLYNGQVAKGVVLHIGMWFAVIFAVLFFWLVFPLFFPLALWLFNIYDAYDQAKRTGAGEDAP